MAKKSAQEWLRSPVVDTESANATMATDAAAVSANNQAALFPSSLLCFLQFLIDSVTITDDAVSDPIPSVYPNQLNMNEPTRVPCTSGMCLCVCLSLCLSGCLFVSICQCIYVLYDYVSVNVSVCPSVSLYICVL